MSDIAVQGLKAIFERVFSGMEQFLEICPDEIWKRTFGGWPVWQHVYHVLVLAGLTMGESPESAPMPEEVALFSQTPDVPWSKTEAKAFAVQKRAKAEAYFAQLNDATLAQTNERLSKRFAKNMPQSAAISLMTGHLFYHLGVCDSALREQGLKGIL
jgi:hypothetical protein